MRKVYVRELKPYSLAELAHEFKTDASRTRAAVEELMMRGIVRYRTGNDAGGDPDAEDAAPDELYQFRFVGMALVGDLVVIAYPKYFRGRRPGDVELRQILRVLRRDAARTSVASLSEDGERTDDKLPVMLALLELYAEYGVYSNFVEGRELNGPGSIDWGRTIGRHLPIIADDRPVYVEYETRKTLRDESDFITRLHRAVLTECSSELVGAGVAELLSLDEVWLSDEAVDDFGDAEALEWRLSRERGSQFVDWKVAVLRLLERYLLCRESKAERDDVRTLGSTCFFQLWEDACKVAFGDALGARLGELGLELDGEWARRRRETLLGIIPRPKWERRHGRGYAECGEAATLIPDTVTFAADGDGRAFCIYDAKYYVPSGSGKTKGQPGLESVTKQFLYQSAYKKFVLAHGFDRVVNVFLVPSDGSELQEMARVSFSEVMGEVEPPFSGYVHMWALPAHEVFDAYLRGERIDGGSMRAIWESEG